MAPQASSRKIETESRREAATLPLPGADAIDPEIPGPNIVMLLAEPEVRLLMLADHVDEREMMVLFDNVRVHLRGRIHAAPDRKESEALPDRYRPGVGIMLLNARGEIFVGQRADVSYDAWQMPQGGIDDGETARRAALRELKEEIGTANAEIIAEGADWLYYDVPEDFARKAWRGRWKGQRQKWFAMRFRGTDAEIDLAGEHPEFRAWKWVSAEELTALAVSFKSQLYLNVIGQFAAVFRD